MKIRFDMSRDDPRGCKADAEHEAIGVLELRAHEAGECRKGCSLCELERILCEIEIKEQ